MPKFPPLGMAWESGPTLPTSPETGQLFLHTPAGRTILVQYDGANWHPIFGHGVATIYVDGTNGTDDMNYGFGPGADAFATIQYAVNALPRRSSTSTRHVMYIASGNYAEDVTITGAETFFVEVNGTLSTLASLVATGGSAGAAGANPANITGAFAAGAHDGKLVKFTSGANDGEYRLVGKTTATHLWLVGRALPAAPVNLDTYNVLDWGTVISGRVSINRYVHCSMLDLAFTRNVGADVMVVWGKAYATLNRCKVTNDGISVGIIVGEATVEIFKTYFDSPIAGSRFLLRPENLGVVEVNECLFRGNSVNGAAIRNIQGSGLTVRRGTVISGFGTGILNDRNSFCGLFGEDVYNYIHGCATAGIRAETGAQVTFGGFVTYGVELDGAADANGTDESVDAASYGRISA